MHFSYANIDDADTIAFINAKSFQKAFQGIIPDSILNGKFSFERLRERLINELNEGTTRSCIMYMDHMAIGMLTIARDDYVERDTSEIDIWRIYLLPEYWDQKFGLEFIEWAINELKSQGYKRVGLWVLEENNRARRFYEKVGFLHDGEIRLINPGRELKEYRYIKNL